MSTSSQVGLRMQPGGGSARPVARHRSVRNQRGMGAILLLLLLIGAAAGAALFSFSRSDTVQLDQDRATTQVLMSAKAALLGYAVSRGVSRCSNPSNTAQCAQDEEARPGELPCPDTNNDGIEDSPCLTGPLVG